MSRYIFDLRAHENNTSIDAKDWVEEQFPEARYGENIEIFEAWDLRSLFQQAYMAGKESMETELTETKARLESAERLLLNSAEEFRMVKRASLDGIKLPSKIVEHFKKYEDEK